MVGKVPGHRIAIKPNDIETKTASGIYIAVDERMEKAAMTRGIVRSVGADAWKTMYINGFQGEPWAKVGDEVVYAKYVGFDVPVGDETWRIVNDEDIVFVYPKNEVAISQENLNG